MTGDDRVSIRVLITSCESKPLFESESRNVASSQSNQSRNVVTKLLLLLSICLVGVGIDYVEGMISRCVNIS